MTRSLVVTGIVSLILTLLLARFTPLFNPLTNFIIETYRHSVQRPEELSVRGCQLSSEACIFDRLNGKIVKPLQTNEGVDTESAGLNSGTAFLSLQPRPIRSSKSFNFEVKLTGVQPDRVWIDLQGKEMYMGVNQTELTRTISSIETFTENETPTHSASSLGALWSAPGSIGLCTTGEMIWNLRLILETAEQQKIYLFEFEA